MPIVFTTRRVAGSMRVTVKSLASPTQIPPSPPAIDAGFEPTSIDATTRFVFGSTTTTAGATIFTAAGVESRVRANTTTRGDRGDQHDAGERQEPPSIAGRTPAQAAARARGLGSSDRRGDRRRRLERGILGQDGALEPLELRPRLEPELVGEQPAAVAVDLQRVALPAAACGDGTQE